MCSDVLVGELIQPGIEIGGVVGKPVVGDVLVQDAKGVIEVTGAHELLDGQHILAGLFVPLAGP